MGKNQTFVDKCFKNRHGKLALTARPNAPIIIWAIAALSARLITHGNIHSALGIIAFVLIVIWALLEILQGVNYFRRVLGAVVLAFTIYTRFFA
jgi:hypothetical protein